MPFCAISFIEFFNHMKSKLYHVFICLGLSWIFGFLAVGEAKLTFEYLFSITTPLQGFLLAVFFVSILKFYLKIHHI